MKTLFQAPVSSRSVLDLVIDEDEYIKTALMRAVDCYIGYRKPGEQGATTYYQTINREFLPCRFTPGSMIDAGEVVHWEECVMAAVESFRSTLAPLDSLNDIGLLRVLGPQ